MSVLPIILAPDPVLKRKCAAVEHVDDAVRRLMDDLLETMYAAPGVGLAAPQTGVLKRVIVVDISGPEDARAPLMMANPEIIEASAEATPREEGCLSFPDHYAEVTRPDRVRVRYLDHENEIREIEADGLLSTCVQHEMDHLDGVLFVDRLSMVKRGIILRKMTKLKKAEAAVGA